MRATMSRPTLGPAVKLAPPVVAATEQMPNPTGPATQATPTVVTPPYGVIESPSGGIVRSGWFWAAVIGGATLASILLFGRR